jgi:protein SCO1/2
MMNGLRKLVFALSILVAAFYALGCSRGQPQILNLGGDFTLTDQDGMPFQLSSLRGSVVLIFFGYTSCPDVCPTTMSKLATVYRDLGADAARVKTVYISVDTERDTPPVLKEYLTNFKSVDAIGLTGTVPEIGKVTAMYGARYEITPLPAANGSQATYSVAHTTSIYALDAQGRTRIVFPYESSVAEMSKGIRALLRENAQAGASPKATSGNLPPREEQRLSRKMGLMRFPAVS